MPRRRELTWQQGSDGRKGRWRKKYKGRILYFAHGSSKSDLGGYRLALEAWKRKKAEIDEQDASIPKPHQADYEKAIEDWQLALQWARNNGHDEFVDLAKQKIETLRERLAGKAPPPLSRGDAWQDQFEFPTNLIESVADSIDTDAAVIAAIKAMTPEERKSFRRVPREESDAKLPSLTDPLPNFVEKEIWRDRIETERRKANTTDDTIEAYVDSFLAMKRSQVDSGEISVGRYDPLRVHLHHFRDWLGGSLPVKSITGKAIADYYSHLMRGIGENDWSADYARDRLNAIKMLVRWLWALDLIDPPKILESRELRIRRKTSAPRVFTKEEVSRMLSLATARTKLYILLMLNCGMGQKDISDLRQDEVDWENGTVTRKRSKTAHHENVPTVTYKLWPETLRLLQQERAKAGDYVLVNEDGGRLKVEELDEAGSLRKIDNVASAFSRLKRTTKIKKPIKLLRKTSATLLRSQYLYAGIESLFLGHAPRSIADRHYAAVPQDLLDQAIEWLGKELGIVDSNTQSTQGV